MHTNVETGKTEKRYLEVSAWRTISFFGFIIGFIILILLCTYNSNAEKKFEDKEIS